MTGNYDPETKTIYWGVGNAAPWPGSAHASNRSPPGIGSMRDNGKIKACTKYHQNDYVDWDEASTHRC